MAVVLNDVRFDPGKIVFPEATELRASDLTASFDDFVDTLYVRFHGKPLPAISVPLDTGGRSFLYLRVDPETHRVVGLQIEGVSVYAKDHLPSIRPLVTEHPVKCGRQAALLQVIDDARRLMANENALTENGRQTA